MYTTIPKAGINEVNDYSSGFLCFFYEILHVPYGALPNYPLYPRYVQARNAKVNEKKWNDFEGILFCLIVLRNANTK